ncbi:MAG: ATP-binding protein [Kibdelosporangium sp.]
MRGREKQAIEAISGYFAGLRHLPDLDTLALIVGSSCGATGCALTVDGRRHQWGDGPQPWWEHVVEHGGEPQGTLAITPGSLGPMPAVAAVLGAPLAAVHLTTQTDRLRREGDAAARDLVDDRWRAAVEMEQERRRLERDLHDGAQHHLVALKMAVAVAEHAPTPERVADLLDRLDTAERVLRDTAGGILPITLATDGLAAALTVELAGHDDVALDVTGLRRRHPQVAESAVYFVCLEAVNNAHKHAPGAQITATVRDASNGIEFAVADTGGGFVIRGHNPGLHNMTTRVQAAGGTMTVRSSPGEGTSVTGFVPQ